MDFRPSEAARAFSAEVRSFLAEHWTEEGARRVEETGTLHDWDLHRAAVERGWLRSAMPVQVDGAGRAPEELATLFRDFEIAGAPYDGTSITMMVAAILSEVGSAFHKDEIVTRLLAGEGIPCLGYSEPECGSDVAAVRTRAVRSGDGWQIDGQKMWTSLADVASWVLLLTRTDPDVPKHRGLTFFLVPLDTPGVEIQEIRTLSGKRTNATYYDGVQLDDRWRVGEVNGGWDVMRVALSLERGVMGGLSDGIRLLAHAERAARETRRPDGRRLIDDPAVRERLVRTSIDNEVADLLGDRAAWVAGSGERPGLEGSEAKLFATEALNRATDRLLDCLGPRGLLQEGEPQAPVAGFIEHCWRFAPVTVIAGGTSEIQRNHIAERMLGLPRAR
ncbi:MAG: acyl-CoA dehydrogenase family protein [Deltaproteobacteria bacterium]|jgi:alkylation response protein AidB-like acyl-CoA dehydrogenase|nr:acyl-CoA dehydrogenase family protein [Deltaproteobacteria bacterium]